MTYVCDNLAAPVNSVQTHTLTGLHVRLRMLHAVPSVTLENCELKRPL